MSLPAKFDMGYYILDEHHNTVHLPCTGDDPATTIKWGRWLEEHQAERLVKQERVGDYEISTVFMGLDFNHMRTVCPRLKPHLFETMVFSGFEREGPIVKCERCATWDEAEEQHARIAAEMRRLAAG